MTETTMTYAQAAERYRHVPGDPVVHAAIFAEVERLREDCAEAYQAVGFLAHATGYWAMAADDPRQHQITKLLDNLSHAADGMERAHSDLLPFGWEL